jgi:hypothetical protein
MWRLTSLITLGNALATEHYPTPYTGSARIWMRCLQVAFHTKTFLMNRSRIILIVLICNGMIILLTTQTIPVVL